MSEEVRLESGQIARVEDGGTVRVIPQEFPKLPEYHFRMQCAHRRNYDDPVTEVRGSTYEGLVEFLKQLEKLDYLLLNIERVEGTFTPR